MNDDIPKLIRDVLYAEQHHLLDDDVGRAVMRIFDAGVADNFTQGVISDRVRKHKVAQAFSGPFPVPNLTKGDLLLGLDLNRREVRIPIQWLNTHSVTIGASGSGKTTRAMFHAIQIASRIQGLWLFDCAKREWQKIKPLLARLGIDLSVLPGREMRFNPLQCPRDVDASTWLPRLADMLSMVMELPPRAKKLLESTLYELFRQFGIVGIDDGKKHYPTLYHVLESVKRAKDANTQARHALLDALDSLLSSLGPGVLAYKRGWEIHELAQLPINFVLSGIADAAMNLILNTLLMAEFSSRLARSVSNCPMDLCAVLDEAQRVLSQPSSQRNALAPLWPLVRGTGIGLDCSIVSCHGLMPEALSFCSTKYIGRCASATDYKSVGASMRLTEPQYEYAFHKLRTGQFICQTSEGDSRHPYLLTIPPMTFPNATACQSDSATVRTLLPETVQ